MNLSDEKFFRQLSVQRDLRLSPTPQNDAWITSEKAQKIKKWITYYRRNWDLFAEEVLCINQTNLYLIVMTCISQYILNIKIVC